LFRRGLNYTRREYTVRLCRSWFFAGRLAHYQKDCAQYDNDPDSKPESSPPFRGWLDIFSIARCQVIHMQLPLLYDTAGHMQSVLFYSAAWAATNLSSRILL